MEETDYSELLKKSIINNNTEMVLNLFHAFYCGGLTIPDNDLLECIRLGIQNGSEPMIKAMTDYPIFVEDMIQIAIEENRNDIADNVKKIYNI